MLKLKGQGKKAGFAAVIGDKTDFKAKLITEIQGMCILFRNAIPNGYNLVTQPHNPRSKNGQSKRGKPTTREVGGR